MRTPPPKRPPPSEDREAELTRLRREVKELRATVARLERQASASAVRFAQVSDEARTDALTGLGHHGAFMADLCARAELARAEGRALGVAMIDIDGFKVVNDRIGHLAGDALLAGLAARMRGVVRLRGHHDTSGNARGEGVYRYGGDEFAAIVPGADEAAMVLVGDRIRRAVSAEPFALGEGRELRMTCSVGVASLAPGAEDANALIAAADEALRRAKARGKNKVERA